MNHRKLQRVALLAACLASAAVLAQQPPGTVLVTGSNRGLGLEFVRQYAARGWKVVATARNPEAAGELRAIAAKNRNVTLDRLDVEDVAAIKALAAKYKGTAIDVLINNAGVLGEMKAQSSGALDYSEFEEGAGGGRRVSRSRGRQHAEEDRLDHEPLRNHLAAGVPRPVLLSREQGCAQHGDARLRR